MLPAELFINLSIQRLSCVAPTPTGVTKELYLETVFGIVNHFRQFQDQNASSPQYGKIIDPYAGMEIQYSTPCFANAAATLLRYVGAVFCSQLHS